MATTPPTETRAAYDRHLASYDPSNPVIMDLAHIELICGVIRAHKPFHVLEFGIGTGFLSRAMLHALSLNGRGRLTCVDNAHDWQGAAPPHFQALSAAGANVVLSDEGRFLASDHGSYDVIVCDGDHQKTDVHAKAIKERCSARGFMFFHDTANRQFPNLRRLVLAARYSGLVHHEFTAASLPGERTERGLLLVVNDSRSAWRLPPWIHLRSFAGRWRRRLSGSE
jgi:predicted O-methyltransferase YrrM